MRSNSDSISELVLSLKTEFRDKEFKMVEQILKVREEEIKMEKEEAEKHAVALQNKLGIYEIKCAELSKELEEKRELTTCIKDLEIAFEQERYILKVREEKMKMEKEEVEKHAVGLQKNLGIYETNCVELLNELEEKKELSTCLKEDLEIACERERRSQERITKMCKDEREKCIELKTLNGDLECAKRRAENEIKIWKKRCEELESQVLVESQVSRKVLLEPEILSAEISGVNEGNQSERRQSKLQVGRDCALNGAFYCEGAAAKKNEVPQLAGSSVTQKKKRKKVPADSRNNIVEEPRRRRRRDGNNSSIPVGSVADSSVTKKKNPGSRSVADNMVEEARRCIRSDGKGWRCNWVPVQGQKYCERHVLRAKARKKGVESTKQVTSSENIADSSPKIHLNS